MIGVIATLKVQAGKGADLEAVFSELAAKVKANEAGCILYQLTKSRSEPDTYRVMELYASNEALKQHGASDYFRAAGPGIGACLAAPLQVEYLDAVD